MGVYHTFYLEGKIDGKWRCLCPKYTSKNGTVCFHDIISGKSFLHELSEEFCENRIDPSEDIVCGEYSGYYLFDAEAAQKFLNIRTNENQGYVEKHDMEEFRRHTGELFYSCYGIHEWLTPDKFRALSSEAQKAYVYFEWTNRHDIIDTLRKIFNIAEKYKEMYERECDSAKPTDYRIVVEKG